MILVDTSEWIDHLHAAEPALVRLLASDEFGQHPTVVEELALGSLGRRDELLELLTSLWPFPRLSHRELLALVRAKRLWGRAPRTPICWARSRGCPARRYGPATDGCATRAARSGCPV